MAIKITGTTIIDDSLNITASVGTVDGRTVSADGTKLDGIEAAATADQTGAEIKALYEAETNAFTNAQFAKLGGIENSAKDDQTASEIKALYEAEANAFTDALFTKLGTIETSAKDDQTAGEIKALYEAEANAFTDALFTKLSNIETAATADQTAAQIKTAYEGEASAFTDAQFTKLSNIETAATADQTDAEIKTAVEAASSIALGGSPTTTTQAADDNSTKVATTAYADAAAAAVVAAAPEALNTLNELAAALGDDANYATTTATAIGTKMPLAGGAFTGAVTTNSTIDGRDVAADGTKLDGVEANATADQTGAQIKAAYEAETNAFTDAQFTKLGAIEANATADQTDAEIKTAVEAASDIALGGNPTTTTQTAGNNTTRVATTEFVTAAITAAPDTNTEYTAGTGMTLAGTVFNCDIDSPAEVGLGNLSASGNNLAGDFVATGNITAYSDERLKTDVELITNAVDKVEQLDGVTFTMNGERGTGVIAQMLEEVLPEAVFDNESGFKSVAYGNVIGLLIEAIKEQSAEIETLKSRVDNLQK
jgi:hypothetical protein